MNNDHSGLNNTKERISFFGAELLAWGSSKTHPDAKEISPKIG